LLRRPTERDGVGNVDLIEVSMLPERNVEVNRRFIEAYNAHDAEPLIACCDPSIEFHSVYEAVGGVYHGHDGMREFLRDLADTWETRRMQPEAFFDLGEHTLAFYVLHGQGRHSGMEVAMPIAAVARWRNGLMMYWKSYVDREEALSDLGVSEDELEPIEP
jgi:ketosteroid isomerase-like protein